MSNPFLLHMAVFKKVQFVRHVRKRFVALGFTVAPNLTLPRERASQSTPRTTRVGWHHWGFGAKTGRNVFFSKREKREKVT